MELYTREQVEAAIAAQCEIASLRGAALARLAETYFC
jgi:hypothetical protein